MILSLLENENTRDQHQHSQTCHAWYFPQEARKQDQNVIQQMFSLVLLAMMTYGIAAKPEGLAILKDIEEPKALSFLGRQMVAAMMALVTKMMINAYLGTQNYTLVPIILLFSFLVFLWVLYFSSKLYLFYVLILGF